MSAQYLETFDIIDIRLSFKLFNQQKINLKQFAKHVSKQFRKSFFYKWNVGAHEFIEEINFFCTEEDSNQEDFFELLEELKQEADTFGFTLTIE
jgi:hypothetical protein